jgi:hypothetical protein
MNVRIHLAVYEIFVLWAKSKKKKKQKMLIKYKIIFKKSFSSRNHAQHNGRQKGCKIQRR